MILAVKILDYYFKTNQKNIISTKKNLKSFTRQFSKNGKLDSSSKNAFAEQTEQKIHIKHKKHIKNIFASEGKRGSKRWRWRKSWRFNRACDKIKISDTTHVYVYDTHIRVLIVFLLFIKSFRVDKERNKSGNTSIFSLFFLLLSLKFILMKNKQPKFVKSLSITMRTTFFFTNNKQWQTFKGKIWVKFSRFLLTTKKWDKKFHTQFRFFHS